MQENNYHNGIPFPSDQDAPRERKGKSTPVASASGGGSVDSKTRIGFKTIKASELIQTDFAPLISAVDDLIVEGLTLLCGASKIGKSWFVLDLCYSVASGNSFLDRKTTEGDVLYLALEDSERRLKDRLVKLGFANTVPEGLEFSTRSDNVDNGLLQDIEAWISKSEKPRLIVIDTLQKIRGKCRPGVNAYDADYEIIGKLKSIADKNRISIVLVHHLNKMKAKDASDPFDRISGSTGLMAAADSTILLLKDRSNNTATVAMTGRDIHGDDFIITINDGKWTASGFSAQQFKEDRRYAESGIIQVIKDIMSQCVGNSYKITIEDFKEKGAWSGYLEFAQSEKAIRQELERLAPLLMKRDHISIGFDKRVGTKRGLMFSKTKDEA